MANVNGNKWQRYIVKKRQRGYVGGVSSLYGRRGIHDALRVYTTKQCFVDHGV